MAATSSEFSYLIVGSGVFGASTAYHLSESHPEARIALLDRSPSFPCPLGASHDFNKIIRADYESKFYCKLALEAQELWRSHPYKEFYHQTGMVVLGDPKEAAEIIQNYVDLGAYTEACIISIEELKRRYGKIFEDTDYSQVTEAFVNPLSGWAEATKALTAVIEAATNNGVQYIKADIESLLFDEDGNCHGVRATDGKCISAAKIVLSTGAGTAKLLADSAPARPDLHAGDRISAAAVVTGVIMLPQEKMKQFETGPVFVHAGSVSGQVIPPNEARLFKFCVDGSFKNTSLHKSSGQMISAPLDTADQGQTSVSQALKDDCARVVKGLYGNNLDGLEFDSFRICWDGVTPNQDFIISNHPSCQNLYIVTGGSFHGWKFLPIIGKYAVKMLDGTLERDLVERWGWDRNQEGSSHTRAIPNRELSDIN